VAIKAVDAIISIFGEKRMEIEILVDIAVEVRDVIPPSLHDNADYAKC